MQISFEGTNIPIGSKESVVLMRITVHLARAWLARNTNNRPVRTPRVAEWKAMMEAGQWQRTHQGIAFDNRGILIDGQHRLLAIVEMGGSFSVECYVFFNVDPETKKYMDIGGTRSIADRDPSLPDTAVEIARLYVTEKEKRKPSLSEIQNFYEKHKEAIDWIKSVWSSDKGICRTPIKMAFVTLYESDPILASSCWEALRTGANLQKDDPMLRLRNLAINGKAGVKICNHEMGTAAHNAVKAVTEGRTLGKIYTKSKTRGR
jgi:hypothetical protein